MGGVMSSVTISGDTSGSIILQAPSVAGSTTLTLPTTTGTLVTSNAMPTGSVLQVVQGTYATQTSSSTSTYADTGLTATITPSSSSNKILVFITHPECFKSSANAANRIRMMLVKNGSNLIQIDEDIGWTNSATSNTFGISFSYLDSPSSTSALTYKTQFANPVNVAAVYVQYNNMTSAITLMEIKG